MVDFDAKISDRWESLVDVFEQRVGITVGFFSWLGVPSPTQSLDDVEGHELSTRLYRCGSTTSTLYDQLVVSESLDPGVNL